MATPGDRLRIYRKAKQLTQGQFGKLVDMPAHKIKDMESGKVKITHLMAKLLSMDTDLNPLWLLEEVGDMVRPKPTGTGPSTLYIEERTSADRPTVGAEELAAYMAGDFVFIPQVRGEISAGGGLIADNTIEMRIAFRRDWIERKGDSQNMSLIRVSGDSMEPTLLSGDLVLVDHNRNVLDPQGGIYAISMDSIIMIKRIQLLFAQNMVKIISDNQRYEPLMIEPGRVRINGKVVWFGREIER